MFTIKAGIQTIMILIVVNTIKVFLTYGAFVVVFVVFLSQVAVEVVSSTECLCTERAVMSLREGIILKYYKG